MHFILKRFKKILDSYSQNHNYKYQDNISNDLIEWLCKNSPGLRSAMRSKRLNKLSDKDIGYLIPTLENKQHFESKKVKYRLEEKLSIIESNQLRGFSCDALYPNLDSLYSKVKDDSSGRDLCEYLIIGCKDTNYFAAKKNSDIIDVLASTKDGVLESINFHGISFHNFRNLNKEHLKMFLDYDCDNQLKNVTLHSLLDNVLIKEKLRNLSENDFNQALNFILKILSFEERIRLIDYVVQDEKFNRAFADKIDGLPLSFIKYLGGSGRKSDGSIEKDKIRLLDDISCIDSDRYTEEYYNWIINTPKEQLSNLLELVVNENFCAFSMQKRSEIIHQLGFLGYDMSHPERDQERYRKKRDFLVGDLSNPGFLTEIDDEYLNTTFSFINQEQDLEVLKARFTVLNRMKNQVQNYSLSVGLYQKYLSSLNDAIKDMKSKDKIKYLKAHSKYFEKHSLEEFREKINNTVFKSELVETLDENKKYKNLKYSFKLVDFIIDSYKGDSLVASKIIKQMTNCQTHEDRKKLFKSVNCDEFCKMSVDKQRDMLDNELPGFPMVLKSEDVEDMEVFIPDYPYVKEILKKKQEMTLEDKDTKVRVKFRQKKPKGNKKD